MKTYEITDEIFEESSKEFGKVKKDSRIRDRHDPIAFHTFDDYEKYNRTVDDWSDRNDNPSRQEETLKKFGVPPRAQYNHKKRVHHVIDILSLVDNPGRQKRPEK